MNEHGSTRTLAIAPPDWFSIGFGRLRLTIFRIDTPAFGLFGLVLERGDRAQGFLTLRDGSAREVDYDLTGEGAQTAELIYVHSDHLSTPRLATNDTQTVVWRWAGEAFGNTTPNEDPDGDGIATTVNLRFPGQYFDQETGLHYNWNRYYDPGKGRYVTSDPIGLDGGLNTYTYVDDNPLQFFDRDGLVTWTGTIKAGGFVAFVGAGGMLIEVRTKYINGKRGFVKALAVGPGAGVGIKLPKLPKGTPSGTVGGAEFNDPLIDVIDPNVFNGRFEAAGAAAVVGGGIGHQLIRCGRAFARVTGKNLGLDVGATGFAGTCTVLESRIEDCTDCNQ